MLAVTNTNFESLYRVVTRAEGVDELNTLVLPGDIDTLPVEEINKIAEERLPEIEDRLLRPFKMGVKSGE